MGQEKKMYLYAALGVVGLILFFILNPFKIVGARDQLVVFNRLTSNTSIKGTGLRFVAPLVNQTRKYSVRTQKSEYSGIEGLSSDSQTLRLNIVVNWKLDGLRLSEIFKTIQGDITETIMYNAILDTTKAELGKFKIDDIARNRETLRTAIQKTLFDRLKDQGILVSNISVTDVDFNENYETAIEQKMIAEQQALEAKNLKLKVQYDSEAKAIENRNLSQTITPLVLRQKWIEKWDGKLPVTMTGAGTDLILNLQ